ncbi:MAG: hypothetical protein AVO33_05600 [delta proteobacterium ML8_F1]|nr:MAG: hypothetical protein AVO33_05600 [delta proteobacterium ML8_F1]
MPRPVWLEINLDHLAHNIQEVRRLVEGKALITAVIKADGYGHGAVAIGQTLLDNGADRFAVATLSEAVELRMAFESVEILVLGYTPEEDFPLAEEQGIILTLYDYDQAAFLVGNHPAVKVHLKVDTGMSRLGFRPEDPLLVKTATLKGLNIEGIYTHFAKADEEDPSFTMVQIDRFNRVLSRLEALGVDIPIRHVANSAGIIEFPMVRYDYDMVRAGIMLYGLYPSKEVDRETVRLRPVMALKARAALVKTIHQGDGVSYGLTYTAAGDQQVVTLPLGYADGLTRMLSGRGQVSFKGERRDILGRICMDQCVMDGEGLEIRQGDTVEIFGEDIPVEEIADALGTINYEIVCMMSKRIPRVYIKGGVVVDTVDYIQKLSQKRK